MSAADAPAAVRPANEDDLAAVEAIYAHYVERTYITFDLDTPTLEDWRRTLRTARDRDHPFLVTERDGRVCGYAMASAFRPKAAYRSTVETTIYLEPEAVGSGLGRPLYAEALRELSARSFHLAIAVIALPNARSIGMHEDLGYTRVGVIEEVGHKLGEWRDVGWWQRRL